MIRRPPRSTQSRSSAASDVYKRQVVVVLIGHAHCHHPRFERPGDIGAREVAYMKSLRRQSVEFRQRALKSAGVRLGVTGGVRKGEGGEVPVQSVALQE